MKLLVDGKIMATVFSGSKTVLVLIFYWHRHTKSFLRYWSKTTSHRIKTYRYICTKFKPNTGSRPVHGLACYATGSSSRKTTTHLPSTTKALTKHTINIGKPIYGSSND